MIFIIIIFLTSLQGASVSEDTGPFAHSVDCNFEEDHLCGWNQNSDGWKFGQGSDGAWRTSPTSDHNFRNGTGRFIYPDSGSIRRGPPQTLWSPVINSSDTCLSFWYYMSGNRTGYLTVSIVTNIVMSKSDFNATESSDRTMLWNREGQSDDRWYQAEMTIQAEWDFRVLLEATTKRRHYEIALDDIRLHNSPCKDICTFDDGLCSWVQGQTDDFDWKRQSGPTSSNYTGPLSGHTNGKVKVDYYMYINATSASKGGKAVLRHKGFYRPGRACLSFWYHMYGEKMGQLRVDVQRNRESPFPVWSKKGDQGTNWTLAAVDLEVGPSVSLEFVGIRGNGARGDIALDDVSLLTRSCFDCTFDEDVCLWQENEHWKLSTDEGTEGKYVFLSVSADCVPYSGRNFSTPVHAMSGPVCVTFMYFLVGPNKNHLQLYMLTQSKELLIWKVTASNKDSWNYVSISVEKRFYDFTLVFEMYSYSNCTVKAGIDNIFVKFGKCEELSTSPMPTVKQWEDLDVSIVAESQQHDITKVSPYQATSSKSVLPEKRKTESRELGTSPMPTVKQWEDLDVSIVAESQQHDITKVSPYQATSSKGVLPEKRKTESRAGVIAGSVVGSIVFAAFTLYATVWIFKKIRQSHAKETDCVILHPISIDTSQEDINTRD